MFPIFFSFFVKASWKASQLPTTTTGGALFPVLRFSYVEWVRCSSFWQYQLSLHLEQTVVTANSCRRFIAVLGMSGFSSIAWRDRRTMWIASFTGTFAYKLLTSSDRICSPFSSFDCSRVFHGSLVLIFMFAPSIFWNKVVKTLLSL